MTVFCRFAPSPTGYLHVGNVRAAVINYLFCKKSGGKFMLRLDDTDKSRVKDEYKDGIIEDLAWLGIEYDKIVRQSDRLEYYKKAKEALLSSGRIYECFETDTELKIQRKNQTSSGERPLYNRLALRLTEEEKQKFRDEGRKPYYRFLLEDKKVSWHDKIKGEVEFPGVHFSDPVVFRDNGMPTYTFCSVVDDVDFKITDIIRGEDHITNTAVQIQIFESLFAVGYEGDIPHFSHLSLVKASEGKISKREGGFDVKTLREDGIEAMSLLNLLTQIGTSKAIEIYKEIDQLVTSFDFTNFSKSATNYDLDEVLIINHKLLQFITFEDVRDRIVQIDPRIDKDLFNLMQPNINLLSDIVPWIEIFEDGFLHYNNEGDKEFLSQIADFLPQDTKSQDCWSQWLGKIKDSTDRKGKSLFMPIRKSLTGEDSGPELKYIINNISREDIIKRLKN